MRHGVAKALHAATKPVDHRQRQETSLVHLIECKPRGCCEIPKPAWRCQSRSGLAQPQAHRFLKYTKVRVEYPVFAAQQYELARLVGTDQQRDSKLLQYFWQVGCVNRTQRLVFSLGFTYNDVGSCEISLNIRGIGKPSLAHRLITLVRDCPQGAACSEFMKRRAGVPILR